MLVCAQLNSAVRHAIPLTRLCPVTRATAAQPHRSSSSASPFRLRHSPPWRVIGCRLAQRQRYTAVSVRADITTMDAPAFSADVTVDSIQALTASIKEEYSAALQAIEALAPEACTFGSTYAALAAAHARAAQRSAAATLPAMVHADKEVRAASTAAKDALKQMFDATYLRMQLYQRLAVAADVDALPHTSEERRLVDYFRREFERKGSALGAEGQAALLAKMDQVEALCSQFCAALGEDNTTVAFTEAELAGLEPAFVAGLERDATGKCLVSLKAPEMVPVTMSATMEETRRRLTTVKGQQCMESNGPLLQQAIRLRHECARMLGFDSHAEYMVRPKMAGGAQAVVDFQQAIAQRLEGMLASDLRALEQLKAAETHSDGDDAASVQAWDTAYLLRKHKETLGVDEALVQEYFPMEHVKRETLRIYEELLCLKYTRLTSATVWHEDVEAYAAHDAHDGELQGYFFLDLHPRPGKYAHQCVYPLQPAFGAAADGTRTPAVCTIIGNMTKPTAERPALMRFREVETFFHEFGHVMHCICSKPRYSVFAWAWSAVPWPGGVEQDFLEVPSMMLENWMYEPAVLQRLSRHYLRPEESLPTSVIAAITSARDAMCGLHYRRQLFLGLYDVAVHSGPGPYTYQDQQGLDAMQLYFVMMEDVAGVPCPPGTFPAASWYHLMMGYDAGYYGYLWSEVFAADLFARFQQVGCMDAALGRRYREQILAPGGAQDGSAMLRTFLGCEPSQAAWLRRVGVPAA